jgi:hypothetical protein
MKADHFLCVFFSFRRASFDETLQEFQADIEQDTFVDVFELRLLHRLAQSTFCGDGYEVLDTYVFVTKQT